jgi:hypothetical protein
MFPITVLGSVMVAYGKTAKQRSLSEDRQRVLAALVAAGRSGVGSADIPDKSGALRSAAGLRMAIARVREHLPDGCLPEAVAGRYSLVVPEGDVDAWSLLRLSANPLPADVRVELLLVLLNPQSPYRDLEPSMLLRSSVAIIQQARLRLLERVADEQPALLRGELVETIDQHLELDPFNEKLLQLKSMGLAQSGNRRDALAILSKARKELVESGMVVSKETERLERQLLDGSFAPSLSVSSDAPTTVVLPPALSEQLRVGFVGSTDNADEVEGLLTQPTRRVATRFVSGRSGVGKSRLCAEVAVRAAKLGCAVVYLLPSRTPEAAFGPFLAVLPQLRRLLVSIERDNIDMESRRAAIWAAATSALDDEAAGRTLMLIVDDAQWLDSQSQELVQHLSRLVSDTKVVLMVAGRDEPDTNGWRDLTAELVRSGATQFVVLPVSTSDIGQLVWSEAPHLTAMQREGITREVVRASGGLPGVASIVLGTLVEAATQPLEPGHLGSAAALRSIVAALSLPARSVGLALAVLSTRADVSLLGQLTDQDQAAVMSGVAELTHRQLAIEYESAVFGLAHVLVESAFLDSELKTTVAAMHRLAAEHLAVDLHARAEHEAAAAPFVPVTQAAATLIDSANRYLDDRLYRESARHFRRASQLAGVSPIDPSNGGRYARALDLAGDHTVACEIRQRAFDEAVAADDHLSAMSIAMSGLPEAERIDGDPIVVANLLRVDAQALDRAPRWKLMHQRARQLTIVGSVEGARSSAAQARQLADTPDEHLQAALCERFALSVTAAPSTRVALLDEAARWLDPNDIATKSELLVLRTLDLFEGGAHDASTSVHAELMQLSPQLPPLRRWHSMLFGAMLSTSRGQMSAASQQRAAANEFGLVNGIAEHANAWLAGEFVDLWLARQLAGLRSAVGTGQLDPNGSVLAQAGAATVLDACGEHDEAAQLAIRVARSVLRSPVSQGMAALALVCEVLVSVDDEHLKHDVRAMLACRGESFIVVGAGAATLGPVHRYFAMLEADPAEQSRYRSIALAAAQRARSLTWQAIALRDISERSNDTAAHDELNKLVAGTELVSFIASSG